MLFRKTNLYRNYILLLLLTNDAVTDSKTVTTSSRPQKLYYTADLFLLKKLATILTV